MFCSQRRPSKVVNPGLHYNIWLFPAFVQNDILRLMWFPIAHWSKLMPKYGQRSFTGDRSLRSTGDADVCSVRTYWAGADIDDSRC